MAAAAPILAKRAEAFLKRIRKWDTEFFCVGDRQEAFTIPKPDELLERITTNLDYFCVNYALCLVLFLLVAVVIYPKLLMLVCFFSGLWYALLTRPPHMILEVGPVRATRWHLACALAVFTVLVVLILARTMILVTIGAAFAVIVIHAGFRSVPSKAKDKMGETHADAA
eukprot:CAMPEP_0172726452 /NCGR_PEP_ID=MMETSP1074-20121228/90732_1 /TAXON_ID=2916 /ORGANISM="Ceratium fusus, Strain PA161109" /LENGTH=168 /DNA_ID=CAMNT_0013553471 /DNA_START=62 /DNA_END=568 /DNA_ORIENTATION=+